MSRKKNVKGSLQRLQKRNGYKAGSILASTKDRALMNGGGSGNPGQGDGGMDGDYSTEASEDGWWHTSGPGTNPNMRKNVPEKLIDTEARKERIKTFDTKLEAGLEGTLPEKAKVPDAVKIPSGAFDPNAMLEQARNAEVFQQEGNTVDYNAETGNYTVTAFGSSREMTPKEFAEQSDLNMGDFTSDEGGVKVKIDDQTGPTAKTATAVDEDVVKGDVTKAAVSGKVDSAGLLDAVRDLPLFKSGDGTVEYNPATGAYTLEAFGSTQELTADELAEKTELDLNIYKKMPSASYDATQVSKEDEVALEGAELDKLSKETGTDTLSFVDKNKVTTAVRDTEKEQAARAMAAERAGVSAKNLVDQYMEGADISLKPPKIDEDGNIRQLDERTGRMTVQTPREFAATNDLSFGKEYAEGVTTEDRTKIDLEQIKLEKEGITTSEGEKISEEDLVDLRKIAAGRGIALEELPEYKEKKKKRDTQAGVSKAGTAAQLGKPRDITIEEARDEYRETPQGKKLIADGAKEQDVLGQEQNAIIEELNDPELTPERKEELRVQLLDVSKRSIQLMDNLKLKFEEESERFKINARDGTAPEAIAAEAKYSEMDEVAAGEADTIVAPPEFTKIGKREEKKGYEAKGDAQLVEGPSDTTTLSGRDAVTGTIDDAAETKIQAFDQFAAASRDGVVSEGIDPTLAATMEAQQAGDVTRDEKQTVDIADAVGQTVNIEDMPAFERISKRTAQTGEAATRIGEQLVGVPSADLEGREAILGVPPKGDAAHIYGVPTLAAATMQAVSADERTMAAADMLEVVAQLPPEITAAVIEDPTAVQEQLDIDPDPNVAIALTALPQEALVSVQMEGLLAGMEGGKTPLWARPAVAQVEQMMAQRGLSVSTVGRDALFNAIIQSAMPIAQSNAQALQQYASQKLSNEQQSGVEESKQIMQVRMQNLSNRQVSASQTAQMANDIKAQQGTLDQQAIITEAQQGQEARMATGQFAQQRRQQESAQRQQAAVEILSAEQQTEFENLKAESFRSGKQMDADQQVQLAEYQEKVNRKMRQAELQTDMNKAQLSGEIQIELAHISELNAAEKDKMTVANQDRLTKLTTLMDFKKTNAQLAQEMSKASLSNEQQIRMAELAERAAEDSANFTTDNQYELMRLQNYTKFMSQNTEILQQTEIANFSQEEKFELADLASRNQAASENLTSRQQTSLANLEGRLKKSALDAQMKQEVITQTFSQEQQTDLANLEALNRADADTMSADQQTRLTKYNSSVQKQITQAQLYQDMEKVNLDKDLQLELTNLTNQNIAAKDTMTAGNQTKLVNLQNLVDFKKNNSALSQQMELANINNEQQMRFAELQNKSEVDAANFTEDNRFELAELTAKVQRNVRQAELNSRMEEVNLDSRLKSELAELSEKNTTNRANMSADQQTRLANLNVLVDFKKTNAAMAQQMELANLANDQQMELANLHDKSTTATMDMTEENRFRFQQLNNYIQTMSQNEQLLQQADLANLSMEEKISLANLSSRSQADMASMSAQNIAQLQVFEKKMQAGQVNAQLAQQMGLANLSNDQQASMFNAQIDANLDMKQFDADQQVELANSQFMKTMTVKDFDADQQSSMQNATTMAAMDMASADHNTKLKIENARNFLQMDMANLSNDQQAFVLDQQLQQQRLLSDQSAANAAKQFNAASENDINKFMSNMAKEVSLTNAAAANNMSQFNANAKNAAEARDKNREADVSKFNASMKQDIAKFNADVTFRKDSWNAANAAAVEAADISSKRRRNEIDTATQNAINMQNASNSFKLSTQSLAFLNQEMRDQADMEFKSYESAESRIASIMIAALGAGENTFDKTDWSQGLGLQISALTGIFKGEGG
jgi:hypothetical protein